MLAGAVWAGLGFQIVIFMAGLRAIPGTYYEAARIDGVSNWTILWRITLPLLTPTIVRSEEHTSELQSLMRISYAVFCLKKTQVTTADLKQHTASDLTST